MTAEIVPLRRSSGSDQRLGYTVDLYYDDTGIVSARVRQNVPDDRVLADDLEKVARSLRQSVQKADPQPDDVVATFVVRRSSGVCAFIYDGLRGSLVAAWLQNQLDEAKALIDDL